MYERCTVITRGRQPLKRSIIHAAWIERRGPIVGARRSIRARSKQARCLEKLALNERQAMPRVTSVRCSRPSRDRGLSPTPLLPRLIVASPRLPPLRASSRALRVTGDLRGAGSRDLRGSLIRFFGEHRQQQLPLPLCPLCILTGRRMTDQLRGSVRPRISTREYAAYLLQSLSCSRGDGGGGDGDDGETTGRPVPLRRLTSDKSRGPAPRQAAVLVPAAR